MNFLLLIAGFLTLHRFQAVGAYDEDYEWESCPQLQNDLSDAMTVRRNFEHGVLEGLCGGDGHWNCTKIVVYSNARAALKQPTRFGIYTLFGLTQDNQYPSFYRPADGQYLFYLMELGQWEYWHQYETWVIGPVHGVAHGGIMIRPSNPQKRCPWHIKWFRSHSWYLAERRWNMWNEEGNPWLSDDTIRVECYDEEKWPEFGCGCDRVNVTSTGRVLEYHPDRLGEYTVLPGQAKEGYTAPVYAKTTVGPPSYLYSHDVQGRVWLMGSTTTTWNLRLNLLETETVPECPLYPRPDVEVEERDYYDDEDVVPMEKIGWEYLQTKRGEHEVWLKDYTLEVTCIP